MTNGNSEGWRKHSGAKEISGDCWKDLEGRTKPQQRDLKTMEEKD